MQAHARTVPSRDAGNGRECREDQPGTARGGRRPRGLARDRAKAQAATATPRKDVFISFLEHARRHVRAKYLAEIERYLLEDLADLARVTAGCLAPNVMARAVGKVKGKTAPNRVKAAFSSVLKYAAGKGIVPAATYFAVRMLPMNAGQT